MVTCMYDIPNENEGTGWEQLEHAAKELGREGGKDPGRSDRVKPGMDYLVSRSKMIGMMIAGLLIMGSLAGALVFSLVHSDTADEDNTFARDFDLDGLVNGLENVLGTDIHKRDTDGDGLSDGDEFVKYRTDPLSEDTDNDGIVDGWKDANGNGRWDEGEERGEVGDPNNKATESGTRTRSGTGDDKNPGSTGTDPLDGDSDDDGVSDYEEIFKFFTDPVKANDILNKTGVLFYDPTLVDYISKNVSEDFSWEGLLVIGLNENYEYPEAWSKHVEVYRIDMKGEAPMVVNGSFVLIKSDSDDATPVYRIRERKLSDTLVVSDVNDLSLNPQKYAFQNIVIDKVRTTGVVYENHTVGTSNGADVFWYLALDMTPTLVTESRLEGVHVPECFYSNLDIVLGQDMEKEYTSFFRNAGGIMEKPGSFSLPQFLLLANTVEYTGKEPVRGDALDVIDPEHTATETIKILGEDPENYRMLFELIEDTNMQLVILGDVNNSIDTGEFTLLLAPRTFDCGDLQGEVVFDDVSLVTRNDLKELFGLDDLVWGDVEYWNIRLGVTSDRTPEVEDYTDTEVSGLWGLLSSGPAAVSADSYFTMTKLSDVIAYISDVAGLSEEEEDMLLKMTNYRDPGFCVMIDNEIDPSELNSSEDIIRNIAFAVVPEANEDALMLRGRIEGVLYDLGEKLGIDDLDMPFIISDRVDIWDDLVELEFSELADSPEDYVTTEENELMVEMEGHVFGTTLKTVAEYLSEVYPVFAIIEYLPFDIGVYDFSKLDDETLTLYHLPLVAVVHGKGEIYTGQYMKVRGWFDICDPDKIYNNLTDELRDNEKLPGFVLDYLDDYLNGDIQGDILDYARDYLNAELDNFMDVHIHELEEHILEKMKEYLGGLKDNLSVKLEEIQYELVALIEQINDTAGDARDRIEENLTLIQNELTKLRSDLEAHKAELPGKLGALFDSFNDYMIQRLPEDLKDNIPGITDLMVIPIRDFLENNMDNYRTGFLSSLGYGNWNEYVDNEFNLDLMISNVTALIDRVDTVKAELPDELDELIEDLIELLGQVYIMDDSVIREFEDRTDNLSESVSGWFEEFREEILCENVTELARALTENLTGYVEKLNDFFDSSILARHFVTIEGYIQVYEIMPGW